MRTKKHQAATRKDLLVIFSELDKLFAKKNKKITVTAIGGVSMIVLGIRERATMDIDIANCGNATEFQMACEKQGIQVDIVTVAATVDFAHAPKVTLYTGKALVVESITPEDLLRLKLERFRKQDPEDIYAIIEKTGITYEQFRSIIEDMTQYYVGNVRSLLLSATIVIERMYPDKKPDLLTTL